MSLTFVDTETTGLDPRRAVLWEIAIITDSGEYSWILELSNKELARAESMALSVGRYYERAGKARQEFDERFSSSFPGSPNLQSDRRQAWREMPYVTPGNRASLVDFLVHEIDTSHLVGAVPSFDDRFLRDFMREHDRVPSWHYHLVDVEALAAGRLQLEPPWKSKDLYRALGVDPTHFDEHTALGDARMARCVYEVVMGLPVTEPGALIPMEERAADALQV